jgi:hypothetical protein
MAHEFEVSVLDTPLGVTFFDGLDIPLVESVSVTGAVYAACLREGQRPVRAGDRLMAVAHRDVSMMSTPQVLTLLAEQSQRLRREVHSSAIVPSGGAVGAGRGTGTQCSGAAAAAAGIVLRFRAATLLTGADGSSSEVHIRRLSLTTGMVPSASGVRIACQ